MLRRLLVLTLVPSVLGATAASADPGAVDRSFGRSGVVDTGQTPVMSIAPLPRGRLLVGTDALRGGALATLGQTGRLSELTPPPSLAPIAVLPDGRFVTVVDDGPDGDVITRRLPSGRVDRSFGVRGAIRIPRSPTRSRPEATVASR